MKATWKVIGISLAVGACAALLSACDGRGSSPFKPVAYSNDELAMHKQDFDKASGTGAVAGHDKIDMSNGTVDAKKVSAVTTDKDGKVVPAPVNTGGALAKTFIDRDSNSGIISALITEVDGLTGLGDAAGAAAIKGIDLHIVGEAAAPKLFIDAQIAFKGQKLNLYVKDYALNIGTNGKVSALPLTLQDSDSLKDVSADNKNDLVGYAFCRETCQTVYVLFSFNDSTSVEAAIIMQDGKIVRSNLSVGEAPVKCFAAAIDPKQSCDGQIVPAAPSTDSQKQANRYLNMIHKMMHSQVEVAAPDVTTASPAKVQADRYLKMVSKLNRAKTSGTTTVAQTPADAPAGPSAKTRADQYLKGVAKITRKTTPTTVAQAPTEPVVSPAKIRADQYLKRVAKTIRSAAPTTVVQGPSAPSVAKARADQYLKRVAKLTHAKSSDTKVTQDQSVTPNEKSAEKLVAPSSSDKAATPKKKGFARRNLAPATPAVQDAEKTSNDII